MEEKPNFPVERIEGAFRLYASRQEVGERIKASLLEKYNGSGFVFSDRNETVGLWSQLYGGNALFTLVNRFGVKPSAKERKILEEIVGWVMAYVTEKGYGLDPILDEKTDRRLFSDLEYIDAMTWTLSMLLMARRAARNGWITISPADMETLKRQTKFILEYYLDSVISEGGEPDGWGYTKDCAESSLYFTYAVIESYNDVDDYLLGNNDLDIDGDTELLDYINAGKAGEDRIEVRYAELCAKIGRRLWYRHKDLVKNGFLNEDGGEISKEQIRSSSKSSALFNNLYLLLIWIYTRLDTTLESEDERREAVSTMNLIVHNVQTFYDELTGEDLAGIVDKYILTFKQRHKTNREISRVLSDEMIQVTSLLPVLIRANNLISFYITRFPQKQMGAFLDMILSRRVEGGAWLWEERKFELSTSVKYVEAIADFYDYYDEYEKPYVQTALKIQTERDQLEKRMTPKIESRIREEYNNWHVGELEKMEEEFRSRYRLEEMINDKIEAVVKEKFAGLLCEALESAAGANAERLKGGADPEGETARLIVAIATAAESFLTGGVEKAYSESNQTRGAITDKARQDLAGFADAWLKYLATSKNSQYRLSNLFDNLKTGKE